VRGLEFRFDDRPLRRRERHACADLAARAFDAGPFYRFLFPDEGQRARSVRTVHYTVLTHPGRGARIRTARDDVGRIVGLSLWLPPGRYPLSRAVQVAQLPGALRAYYGQPGALRVGAAYSRATLLLHPKTPHWYLWLLMTEPALHGRGIGSSLVRETLLTVDAAGAGAYLEMNDPANASFYARLGFEVVATRTPVPGGPAIRALWREPRSLAR
jgi:ribosomal protein S18 acetylase RimI-like enzyme